MENANLANPQNPSGVHEEAPHAFATGNTRPEQTANEQQWFHRIGGGSIENLRLKAKEETLFPPGISLLQASTAKEAAEQIQAAFPRAVKLLEECRHVGSITKDLIQATSFDVVPTPSRLLPNHCRLTHSEGVAGFCDANLERLAALFITTEFT